MPAASGCPVAVRNLIPGQLRHTAVAAGTPHRVPAGRLFRAGPVIARLASVRLASTRLASTRLASTRLAETRLPGSRPAGARLPSTRRAPADPARLTWGGRLARPASVGCGADGGPGHPPPPGRRAGPGLSGSDGG